MSLRLKQLIVIIFLMGFILYVSHRDYYRDVELKTIETEALKVEYFDELTKFSASEIKKDYGFNINDYGEAFYYGHESIMESGKVLLIKLNNEESGNSIVSAIDKKNNELKKLFQSYAPDQYTLLNDCILEQKGNYILYVVSEDAEKIEKAIINCIKE